MQSKYFPVWLLRKYQTLLFVHCNIPQGVFCELLFTPFSVTLCYLCIYFLLFSSKKVIIKP